MSEFKVGDWVYAGDLGWCYGQIVNIDDGFADVEFDTGTGGGSLSFELSELSKAEPPKGVDTTMLYVTADDVIHHGTLRSPKPVADITICGALHIRIDDTTEFVEPTPEQIENLRKLLCIDVKLYKEEEL